VDVPGAAHRLLPAGVTLLDPASMVFEAMVQGWVTQQRARLLKAHTIEPPGAVGAPVGGVHEPVSVAVAAG
jgi:hypothetical protein